MGNRVVLGVCTILLAIGAAAASVNPPHLVTVQGRLTDTGGNPVADGNYSIKFRIYDAATIGIELWSSDGFIPVEVIGGMFSHLLGSSRPLPDSLVQYQSLWLGMTVFGNDEMTPRIRLAAWLYALGAANADSAANARNAIHADSAAFAFSIPDNSVTSQKIQDGSVQLIDLAQSEADVGQVPKWNGSSWEAANDSTGAGGGLALPYEGTVADDGLAFGITNTDIGSVGYFKSTSTAATSDALRGATVGTGNAVYGDGKRTYGYLGGYHHGVYGKHDTTGTSGYLAGDSIGVYGLDNTSTNYGFLAGKFYGAYAKHGASGNFGYLGDYQFGVYGENGSTGAKGYIGGNAGVWGSHPNNNAGYLGGTQYGVSGSAQLNTSIGVHGSHSLGNYGDLGTQEVGVYGYGNGQDRYGVWGQHFSGNYGILGDEGAGVSGYDNVGAYAVYANSSGHGYGVYATSNGTGNNPAAVFAWNTAGGWAIRANGKSLMNGKLSVQDSLLANGGAKVTGNATVTGDLTVNGLVYGFPHPNYNSGWFFLDNDKDTVIHHDLGGDFRDYFVDLQMMDRENWRLNNFGQGRDYDYWVDVVVPFKTVIGAWYKDLGPSTIKVFRGEDADDCDSLRVRIWKVK